MTNGGYVMVSADGLDISSTTAQTVDGLYNALASAMSANKMILLTGALFREFPLTPEPCACCGGSDGNITIFGVDFAGTVDDTDTVTLEA